MLREKIKSIKPSIVGLAVKHPIQANTFRMVGSGFCVSNDGRCLTAAHIYNQLSEKDKKFLHAMIMVKADENGVEHYATFPIELISKADKDDLAVFKLQKTEPSLLRPVDLGDSDLIEIGDDVYFIGFPYAGELINEGFGITLIANKCIISSIKQDGVIEKNPRNWIFLDAISNPGNSGSPVFDSQTNKVIGIVSISFSKKSKTVEQLDIREPMHIAGARPINLAKKLF